MSQDDLGFKYWGLKIALVVSFGVLVVSLIKLTVIKRSYYQGLARDNRMTESVIPVARGDIVDRKGRIIARSLYQYFSVSAKQNNGTKLFEKEGDFSGYKFDGKEPLYEIKRQYPYKESLAFISGYVGRATQDEINKNNCGDKLNGTDLVGKDGVEEWADCTLRGKVGKRFLEVDAKGKYVRDLGKIDPEPGSTLKLSIDAFWQDKIYKMLGGRKIAVVMSEPKTGKIISLVSSPAFDPNMFSYYQDNEAIKKYLEDKTNLPMLDRSIGAKYHPGSVFKIIMSTAGLETGVIDRNTLIEDTGVIKIGDYSYNNWLWTKRGTTDGMVSIVKALQRSNDIFFYKLGERLGVDSIKNWAMKYGLGQKTGVELLGELTGIVPDEKWKLEAKGERWFLGNTYHLSIGQGDLDVTPLQINQMTNVIANRGNLCKMTILDDKKSDCQSLNIKRETVDIITEGMKEACKPGGTAWPLFNFKTSIACKTGTAEVGDGSKDSHAWLTAFAPADDPQISVTVMVERGGEGSDVAAPIVGDVLKDWFEEATTVVPRYTPTPGQ